MAFTMDLSNYHFTFACPPSNFRCWESSPDTYFYDYALTSSASRKRFALKQDRQRVKSTKLSHNVEALRATAHFDDVPHAIWDAATSHYTATIRELESERAIWRCTALKAVEDLRTLRAQVANPLGALAQAQARERLTMSECWKLERKCDGVNKNLEIAQSNFKTAQERLKATSDELQKERCLRAKAELPLATVESRNKTAVSELKRQLQAEKAEVSRLRGFGVNHQKNVRELNEKLSAAQNQVSELRSQLSQKGDVARDTTMAGDIPETSRDDNLAELWNLRAQNAAFAKEKLADKETIRMQGEEIERMRPADVDMRETSQVAPRAATQPHLQSQNLPDAASRSDNIISSQPTAEILQAEHQAPMTPESLTSSLRSSLGAPEQSGFRHVPSASATAGGCDGGAGTLSSCVDSVMLQKDEDDELAGLESKDHQSTGGSARGSAAARSSLGNLRSRNRDAKGSSHAGNMTKPSGCPSQSKAIAKPSQPQSTVSGKARASTMAQGLQRAEEKAPGLTTKSSDERECDELRAILHKRAAAVDERERRVKELRTELADVEANLGEQKRKDQRIFEKYKGLERRTNADVVASELDDITKSFGDSVGTRKKKTQAQIEAQREYGDSDDQDEYEDEDEDDEEL